MIIVLPLVLLILNINIMNLVFLRKKGMISVPNELFFFNEDEKNPWLHLQKIDTNGTIMNVEIGILKESKRGWTAWNFNFTQRPIKFFFDRSMYDLVVL
jgi:hypothetical protein